MYTVLESLKGANAYPIPLRTLVEFAVCRGLPLQDEATKDVLTGKEYNLTLADILLWLSLAPNVSQGGQSYTFSEEQRLQMRNRANALFSQYGDSEEKPKPIYGYKGSRL